MYIYASKIKGGFLFPSEVELNNPPPDGIFVTQVSYGVTRERVASLVKDVLGLSGVTFKVGLHLLRKTAYLFGIWGNADVATIAKSARHKCIDTANDYACDAALIRVHTTIQHNDLNRVKKWIPILLTSPSSAALLNVESIPFACNVVELANRFIVHHLRVSPNHPCATSPTFLCDKSLKFVRPKQAAERIKKLLATLSPEVNAELSMLLDVQLQEKVEAVLARQLAQPHTMLTVPTAATLGITATSNVHHPKKICRQGIIMFDEIAEVKASKDPRKKLEGVLQMATKMASLEMRDITESTCQFAALLPVSFLDLWRP